MKYRALLLLLLMPLAALAHGEEVLLKLAILPIAVIAFLLFMVTIGKRVKNRLILICVYFVSLMLVFSIAGSVPYFNNKQMINYALIIVPIIITLLVHFFLIRKRVS